VTPRTRDFGLAGLWLMLDQITKIWADRSLDTPITIIPGFFNLSLSHNRGALFGMMSEWTGLARIIFLTLLPIIAVFAIAWLLARMPPAERWGRFGLALILGGAVGNLVDRAVYGHVVDFLDVYIAWRPLASFLVDWFGTARWPTFNVADMGLTCGAALWIADTLFRRDSDSLSADDGTENASKV